MRTNNRFAFAMVLALLSAMLLTNVAFAYECTNPNQNGNAAVGEFNIDTGQFTPSKPNWGSFDKVHGAWVTLVSPSAGISFNIFVHGILPDGALDSGPGEDGCDGKGIDDIEACLTMFAP